MPSTTSYNPRTTIFEWGGVVGAFLFIAILPAFTFLVNGMCGVRGCSLSILADFSNVTFGTMFKGYADLPITLPVCAGWILLHAGIYMLPFGERAQGQPLRNGKRLTYHLNGIESFGISHVLLALCYGFELIDPMNVVGLFPSFMLACCIISVLLAVALHFYSYRDSTVLLSLGGNTGESLYDLWVGRELNPRIGELDLKFMFELRPGLIGWSVLNWTLVAAAHQSGTLTWSLLFVAAFHTIYVADALWNEAGNLTMMDIVHDGFGFMLVFGDIVWVPFIYTMQCRFLMLYPQNHELAYSIPVGILGALGYAIFRGSNTQKNLYRRNPKDPRVAHLTTLKTSTGKGLIVSSYWGMCRHPNYLGDWVMTLSQSLMCGTEYFMPFFPVIYFAVLLVHRQLRDEQNMQRKYSVEDWKAYCERVPYRLIPGIY